MSWARLRVASAGSHHTSEAGDPVYAERFDAVLEFRAPGLAPVSRAGEAWHIHPDGSAAYARRFERTFGFYEGLAAVLACDASHHVTPEGRDAYSERYAWCGNFQEGRCTVREPNGAYLHIGAEGRPAYAQRWRYAGDYRSGIAVVQSADGRSTHIDMRGRFLHGRWFADLDVFHKGFARARDERGWTHVDTNGQPAYSRRFAAVEAFYNGQARVERLDGALEVIDERGNFLVELRPSLVTGGAGLNEDASQIPESVLGLLDRVPREKAVAVLLRHSVRGALPPGDAGNVVPITDVGRRLALELGDRLRGRLRTICTSPLLRCVQTAEALRDGAGSNSPIVTDRLLGDPGVFVLDDRRAWSNWERLGHEGVMRHLVMEPDALPGMARPEEAARSLVQHMLAIAEDEAGVHVFVTHDSIVTATAARTLGLPLGREHWPQYLDGAFFWREDAVVRVAYRDHES